MKYQAPKGTFDILPYGNGEDWHSSHIWQYVEGNIRATTSLFGYQEIRTPIFERAEVFTRNVGETSDIVSKEMYLFEDKGKRLMALKPEGTASAMRAFIEHNLESGLPSHKFFYTMPMFRYDRPQAGRYRQHHQFGVEVIGKRCEEQDAEVISLLYTLLENLGLANLSIELNSIGTNQERDTFRSALKEYLENYLSSLSEDSQNRFKQNPLRILDSKDPKDKEIVQEAPSILSFLSPESKKYFDRLQELLTLSNIPFSVNPLLVRGLDYYNETVFEVITEDLGAQNSLGGGGRYDGLIRSMGGPQLPAIGFGAGIERIIQTMIKQQVAIPPPEGPLLYLIPLGVKGKEKAFSILTETRRVGVSSTMDFSGRKLAKVMQTANALNARYVAVIGDEEVEKGIVNLKEMSSGEESSLSLDILPSTLALLEKSTHYLMDWQSLEKPFVSEEQAQFFLKSLNQTLEKTRATTEKFCERLDELQHFLEEPNP